VDDGLAAPRYNDDHRQRRGLGAYPRWGGLGLHSALAGSLQPQKLAPPPRWEDGGRLYDRVFRVTRWKRALPDGAAWFKRGFRKKSFLSHDRAYLWRFLIETCRGELVHWVVMLCWPLFLLWNPPHVGALMLIYALLANLPFIVVQRYNRFRLQRMLHIGSLESDAKREVRTTPGMFEEADR
jgi:hypothetical protein